MQGRPAVQSLHSACEVAAAEGYVHVGSQPHKQPLTSGRRVACLLRMRAVQLICGCLLQTLK